MLKIFQAWKNSDPKIKWFYFQWVIYMLAILISTVYAYGRLDFDRTGHQSRGIPLERPKR